MVDARRKISFASIGPLHVLGERVTTTKDQTMATHFTKRVTGAAMAISVFLLIAGGQAQVTAPLSEIKVTVVDQTGAVIADSEVIVKGASKTISLHTGSDGTVMVTLPRGQYAITASHYGFVKNNVPDLQVVAPAPGELKVALMVGSTSVICGPCAGAPETPLITSDLPNVIEDDPSPVPPIQATTRKNRSLRCLYLWKCSTS
jgi:hypothetical protein